MKNPELKKVAYFSVEIGCPTPPPKWHAVPLLRTVEIFGRPLREKMHENVGQSAISLDFAL